MLNFEQELRRLIQRHFNASQSVNAPVMAKFLCQTAQAYVEATDELDARNGRQRNAGNVMADSTLTDWIQARCECEGQASVADLYRSYLDYCMTVSARPRSARAFGMELDAAGYALHRTNKTRYRLGLHLK